MKYIILILMTISIAAAQPGMFGGGKGIVGQGICGMGDKLELTADQQKQVETFRSDMQKKQIDLTAKVRTLQIEIKDLYSSESPDQKSIESKITEVSKLQNEIKLNHTNFWFAVNKILTEEQKKFWKEHRCFDRPGFRGDAHGNFGKRGGRGDKPGRGMRNHGNCEGCGR